ncbi:rhomboid family intramembrane serine protease [Spiractinospora alimapuensis]|nr:rhomboid family intramembrane serine protease [Spiractinospora alimapuensis]
MRTASVGFHCVDCVAEGNRTVRQARTVFGGRLTQAPYATWTLLGLIAVCFLAQQVRPELTYDFGMLGLGLLPGDVLGGVLIGEWYRFLTSAFFHVGWWHLLFNGFALYVIGPNLERALGHARYVALWVLSAVSGSVLGFLATPYELSVGASGAIFGLFGAALVIGRRLGLDTKFLLGLVGLNLVITFVVSGISWTAHIGGLVGGVVLALVYAYLPRAGHGGATKRSRSRAGIHAALTGGYAALLLGLVVAGMSLYG